MPLGRSILAVLLSVSVAWAADQPVTPASTPCADGIPGAPACVVTAQTRQQARKAFQQGVRLEKEKRLDEALAEFEKAANLVPQDVQYVTLRELVRQQLVYEHTQRGNTAMAEGREIEALGEYRNVLNLDPSNSFAQQQLNSTIERSSGGARKLSVVEQSEEIQLAPKDIPQSFHFRGESRQLLVQVANAYGIVPTIDDTVVSRHVRFDVDNVGFDLAMRLAGAVTKTFWAPLQEKQIIIATDSTEGHRLYDRMAMRTFYVPQASTVQELQDLTNVLRTVFEVKIVQSNLETGTIKVRAPQNLLNAATQFMEGLGESHPEVMLDVRIYEVSRTVIHNFGLHIPNQFNLYNIPIAALGLTLGGGQSIQDLINQLIASGGINQANSSALSALLAQIMGGGSSIFSQPLATFGGGLTLFGVSLGTLSAQFSRSEGNLRSLQHVTVRAAQGKDATINLGSRVPIINATFAPIFNTAAISQAIGNNSFVPPVPSISYEDIGITLKVKPTVHGDTDVSLNMDVKVRALTGNSNNGVPIIGNREYSGSINVMNEQPAVIAGYLTTSEQRSLSGIPGLAQIPVLNHATASNTSEKDEDEFLVVVTPHIVSMAEGRDSEIWLTGVK